MESTNYYNTLIEIADDSPIQSGEVPPIKGDKRSVANLQFEMISENPYVYTSDDVIFTVFAMRKEIPSNDLDRERQHFFSKGQPCFRSSPLTKRYGWGIHSDADGKVAIFGVDSKEYADLVKDQKVAKKKAMRSKRA